MRNSAHTDYWSPSLLTINNILPLCSAQTLCAQFSVFCRKEWREIKLHNFIYVNTCSEWKSSLLFLTCIFPFWTIPYILNRDCKDRREILNALNFDEYVRFNMLPYAKRKTRDFTWKHAVNIRSIFLAWCVV